MPKMALSKTILIFITSTEIEILVVYVSIRSRIPFLLIKPSSLIEPLLNDLGLNA